MQKVLLRLVLFASTMGIAACDEKLATLAGPTPSLEPTFASIQRDIFETTDSAGRTACVNCHTSTGRNPSGGMNLNHDVAYDQLVKSSHKLAEVMYKQAGAQGNPGGGDTDAHGAGASKGASGGDDVIDAEYVDVDKK